MSQKQSRGSMLKRILNIALPTLACLAAAIYIGAASLSDITVEVSLSGVPVGYVESCEDITDAKNHVRAVIAKATNGTYTPDINTDYTLVRTYGAKYLSSDDLSGLIWSEFEDNFCEAYMLYVDGTQVAAHENKAELEGLIKSIEAQILASSELNFDSVEITNLVRIEKQLCLKNMMCSIDEINSLVNPLAEIVKPHISYTQAPAIITTRIGALTVASPEVIDGLVPAADSLTEQSTESDVTLGYNFVNTITLNEVIYHTTKYIEDPNTFVGTDKVITRGRDGEKTVTYEIFYDTDGNIVGREAISETILTPATDKVVKVGTKAIPEPGPTGTFIWPCEAPRGISSPFGWRVIYGKREFHLGIDLPDQVGSPIYAADGGKIVWAGYSPSYGNNIRIEHANGYSTLYAHLSSINVRVGDIVYQGQRIGGMGTTGVSYGSHLHFEVRINGENYDPVDFLPELVTP